MTHQGPPRTAFPAYPASWYLFGRSSQLGRRPLGQTMLGRQLVGFRTESGRAVVMDGRCSHLGANLALGRVVGESIRCPFHHWEYGPDGGCTRIPAQTMIPALARQAAYPTAERHGYVFLFNGAKALFPLPFFFDERPEDFVAGRPIRFVADCSWYMLAANGFDAEHFGAVHDRTLTGPPAVDCPAPYTRRMRYRALVTGRSIFDRLLRPLVGRDVEVAITSWGGPLILVTGRFRRAGSYMVIATRPLEDEKTLVDVIVFAPRSRFAAVRLLQPLGLLVRRWFTWGFMADDIRLLGGIRYNPHSLIASDRLLLEYFHWAAGLPGSGGAGPAENLNGCLHAAAESPRNL
jgi:nitrite reductase/ring-hydroxylating ferredoxin subunit